MKLLLTVVALAAIAHGAPTTSHTMDIGANGQSGTIQIPLVEIVVNMIKDTVDAVAPGAAAEEPETPTPVIVVDQPEVNPVDVVAVNPSPAPVVVDQPEVNPVDVVDVNPAPAPVVVDQPGVNPVDIIAINPEPSPVVVDQPEVNPAPAPAPVAPEVNPVDIIAINPEPTPVVVVDQPMPAPVVLPEPTPAEVVLPEPTPAEVVLPELTPAEVIEVPANNETAGGSQIINVIMNFIFGSNGSLSSVEVPAGVIPQLVTAPRV